jgi:hypothetical protein
LRTFVAIGILLAALPLKAVSDTLLRDEDPPEQLPLWTIWLPGASYFYQGKHVTGAVFSTLEIGGIALGLKYDQTLRSNSSSPYYNFPLLLGLQAYQIEKLTNFRNQLEMIHYRRPDFRYDDLSEKELYLAPFRAKNILTPITGGMVLLAGVFLGLEKAMETTPVSKVKWLLFSFLRS